MTKPEIAMLLAYAAAFDRRTVGKADVEAWFDVIGDLNYEDSRRAIAMWTRNNEKHKWLMPADVYAGVKVIRKERGITNGTIARYIPESFLP